MRIGIYASIIASERGHERNVSGHIQIPLHTARLLRDAGHDVHLLTNEFGPDRTLPACMPEGVELHLVQDGRRRPRQLRGGKGTSGIHVTRLLRQVQQMKRVVREQRLDVLHVFGYTRSAMLGGALALLGLSAPVVVTLLASPGSRLRLPQRTLLRRVSAFVTSTGYTRGQCEQLGLPTDLVPHGIVRDLVEEADAPDRGSAPRRRVLFWRDPTAANGADVVLAAYETVAPEFPDMSFDLAIRPAHDEIPGIETRAAAHPNMHVHRFPYEDGIDLPGLMAESALVVLPFRTLSVDPQLAIAESLAAGVPVITTRLRSNQDLIRPGENGDLVPVGETEPLVDAIRRLLGSPEQLRTMGAQTAHLFQEHWNWDDYAPALVRIYERVRGVSETADRATVTADATHGHRQEAG